MRTVAILQKMGVFSGQVILGIVDQNVIEDWNLTLESDALYSWSASYRVLFHFSTLKNSSQKRHAKQTVTKDKNQFE